MYLIMTSKGDHEKVGKERLGMKHTANIKVQRIPSLWRSTRS
jgi:hypothetical protein